MDVIKTFDDDPLVLEQDIIDIKQLLDESDESGELQGDFAVQDLQAKSRNKR